ncbi:N-acetyltransferase [Streptomyces kasugaensis]|uniref:N-acetyltransferase n=1 Tax=Streptomyces kasugaensis TaxID=1946 RepID=A0A4Q9HM53_STRKA|nr:GNAT family protein [Streptomyces kasugaensis]TBO55866.1 N-acetyltransferase [Streptomyces kasugaensis]
MIAMSAQLTADVLLRPVTPEDAVGLSRAYQLNRAHLRPWEPHRGDAFYTPEGQSERLRNQLAEQRAGRLMPWVLVRNEDHGDGDAQHGGGDGGDVVGTVTLTGITLGPFRSANIGYWIDADQVGRGLACAAVTEVCAVADAALGLHRIEAGTLLDNTASQRVLAKCGFEAFGTAPNYLHIDGAWRDHRLFQKILNDRHP